MRIRNKLKEKTVNDIRRLAVTTATTANPEESIESIILKINNDLSTRHVYIIDETNTLIGSFRMNSVLKYLFPYSADITNGISLSNDLFDNILAIKASELMRRDPLYVIDTYKIDDCAELMLREGINELPVVDENMKLIGQISVFDIIEAYKKFVLTPESER